MSGCDSRNSPIVGSSVKPCTPCPVVYTSIVLEPYRMYPAATCFRPSCRQSGSPADPFFLVIRLWIEKIVPIDTFTSMLVEPSSGSYNTTYLPPALLGGTGTGSASSSDAVTHTRPVCCTLFRTASFANRSSFCCRSPETFTASVAPRMSESPARRTCREMIFAARHMSYSRLDSSPVASGWSRSCSRMNRSIVMTSDPCSMPVRGEGDRAALIRPQHGDAVRRQPRHHLRRRMAVTVVPPHTDHRFVRRQLVEPRVRRRRARAVMAHLEQLHPAHRPRHPPFDRQPRIRLEQHPLGAVRHPQHHAVVVHVERQPHPQRIGAQHLEHHAVHLDPVPRSGRVPARPRRFHLGEELEIQRPPQRLPRLEHQLGIECLDHCRQTAQVIGVAVRRDHHREPLRPLPAQERDHHTPPGVAPGNAGTPVNHNPAAVRGAESGRITLAYIEKMYR